MSGHRGKRRVVFGAVVAGTSLMGFHHARYVEPADVEVVRFPLVLPRLAREFEGYRVALIGDVHADAWMTPGRLLRLVELANAERADLVTIAGDFANHAALRPFAHHVPKLAGALRRLQAPGGVFAVLGNHDHKARLPARLRRLFVPGSGDARLATAETVRRTLVAAGIVELRNSVHALRRGGATLHLCGVDSVQQGKDRLKDVLGSLPAEGAAVLLAHEPDFAEEAAATGRFDLQLSGHSHGGQVRLPILGATVLPPLGRKYPAGLYEVDGMPLYTNRGLGSHPRLRLMCRPEITIITLRTSDEPMPPP